MAGIDDFVTLATQKLGVSGASAKAGAGALLGAIREALGRDDFAKVEKAVPGAGAAAQTAPAPAASGGLGGMLGQASKALGGDVGKVVGLGAVLQKAGITTDKLGGFASTFLEFLRSKLPKDLLEKIVSKVGGLKSLIG